MSTVHNPANFEPSDYSVLDYVDNQRPVYAGGTAEEYAASVDWWKADMERLFGKDFYRKIHSCVHCGNTNVRYITAVEHTPTGETVVFGADCTARLGFEDKHAFKLALLKKRAEAHRESLKAFQAKQAFVADKPALAAAIEQAKEPLHEGNHFVKDVLGKLDRFGSISDKQIAAVVSSLARDVEAAERKAAEAVEVKGDAPSGKQEVTGVILTLEWQEGFRGAETRKMLLKLENNSKVWLTAPDSGDGLNRGDTVTVKATFEVSDTDKHFAFGKRPRIVKHVPLVPPPAEPEFESDSAAL